MERLEVLDPADLKARAAFAQHIYFILWRGPEWATITAQALKLCYYDRAQGSMPEIVIERSYGK